MAKNQEKEKLRKKYADVIDKDIALMSEKEFKRLTKYWDELQKLNEKEGQEVVDE